MRAGSDSDLASCNRSDDFCEGVKHWDSLRGVSVQGASIIEPHLQQSKGWVLGRLYVQAQSVTHVMSIQRALWPFEIISS